MQNYLSYQKWYVLNALETNIKTLKLLIRCDIKRKLFKFKNLQKQQWILSQFTEINKQRIGDIKPLKKS